MFIPFPSLFCNSEIPGYFYVAGDPDTRRLYDDLLKDLNPLERPVESPNDTMSVDFGLTLMQIRNVVSALMIVSSSMLLPTKISQDIINGYVELNMWKSLVRQHGSP